MKTRSFYEQFKEFLSLINFTSYVLATQIHQAYKEGERHIFYKWVYWIYADVLLYHKEFRNKYGKTIS